MEQKEPASRAVGLKESAMPAGCRLLPAGCPPAQRRPAGAVIDMPKLANTTLITFLAMRPLTEEETKIFFEKLAKYIGRNIKFLIDRPDEPHCFRLHNDRVYYVR